MNVTDISVELMNGCSGSCPGCMLSVNERLVERAIYSDSDFKHIIKSLSKYAKVKGDTFRPVLAFGDVIALPWDVLQGFIKIILEEDMRLAMTVTLTNDLMENEYKESFENILKLAPDTVFDLTVDPFRILKNTGYKNRLSWLSKHVNKMHIQTLLSTSVIESFSPTALYKILADTLPDRAISLGFTPTSENLHFNRYKYNVKNAAEYAMIFYNCSDIQKKHYEEEILRFNHEGKGSYSSFMNDAFHVGAEFNVYPVAYTTFGDVILDGRNGGKSLGNLRKNSLVNILEKASYVLDSKNKSGMLRGSFNCFKCSYFESCSFNGVGLVRRLYSEHESKLGGCYGPALL